MVAFVFFSLVGDAASPEKKISTRCGGREKEITRKTMSVISLKGRSPPVLDEKTEVYIGRACTTGGWKLDVSPWVNPFGAKCGTWEVRVALYEEYVRRNKRLLSRLEELRGKTLCCWCKGINKKTGKVFGVCHGDVLVKLLAERSKA
jgi:hypothetical protein